MAENVAHLPFSFEFPAAPRLGKLFGAFGRWLTKGSLTREENLHLVLFVDAAIGVGVPILGALDRQDLSDRIDHSLRQRYLYEFLETLLRARSDRPVSEDRTEHIDPADGTAGFVAAVGAGSMRPLLRGLQDLYACVAGIKALPPNPSSDFASQFLERSKESPLWFMTDPETSAEAAASILSLLYISADVLALAAILFQRKKVDPWLGLALADHWAGACHLLLRHVASIPGTDVPEDQVPITDRFDFERADERNARKRARIDELFLAARESGDPVYPPIIED